MLVPTPNQVLIVRTLAKTVKFTRTRDLAEVSGTTYTATYKFLRALLEQRMVDHTMRPSDAASKTPFHLYRLNDRGREWAENILKES